MNFLSFSPLPPGTEGPTCAMSRVDFFNVVKKAVDANT